VIPSGASHHARACARTYGVHAVSHTRACTRPRQRWPRSRCLLPCHESVASNVGTDLCADGRSRGPRRLAAHVYDVRTCAGTGLTPATDLRRDCACPCPICAGTGLAPAHICAGTGLAPAHICSGTGLAPPTSAPGLGSPLTTSAPRLGSPLRTSAPGLGACLLHAVTAASARAAPILWHLLDDVEEFHPPRHVRLQ
jgi:hypothetical protein